MAFSSAARRPDPTADLAHAPKPASPAPKSAARPAASKDAGGRPGYLQPVPRRASDPKAASDGEAERAKGEPKGQASPLAGGKPDHRPGTKGAATPRAAPGGTTPAVAPAKPTPLNARSRPARSAQRTGVEEAASAPSRVTTIAPLAETGPHTLPSGRLDLPAIDATFDAPRALTARSEVPPSDADTRNPVIARAPAVFAEAVAAAARLHAELTADAARAAESAQGSAATRFDVAQAALDRALARLEAGLVAGRGTLERDTDQALALIAVRADVTRAQIAGAATGALAKLAAAAAQIHTALKGPEDKAARVEAGARAKAEEIDRKGAKAGTNIAALGDNPSAAAKDTNTALQIAQGEAIVVGLPARAKRRAHYFDEQRPLQQAFMGNSINRLHNAMGAALHDFRLMLAKAEKMGPAAVERARGGAMAQVEATVEALTAAISQARDATDAALVRQHNAARTQLTETAEAEARSERAAASSRGRQDVEQALALARAQPGAVKALAAGFAGEQRRPAAELATVVTRGSAGMRERLEAQAPGQRQRLAQQAAEGRAGLDSDAAAANARTAANAGANADAMGKLADETGAAFIPEAEEGCKGLRKLSGPVAGTLKDYLPPISERSKEKIDAMVKAVDAAEKSINAAIETGDGGGGKDEAKTEGKTEAKSEDKAGAGEGKKSEPPKEAPRVFEDMAAASDPDATADRLIAEFIKAAKSVVIEDVNKRTAGLEGQLNRWRSDVDAVIGFLVGLTEKRGNAVRTQYRGDLEDKLSDKLDKWFSSAATNRRNIAAALNYLHGKSAAAALSDMEAAKGWWNDDKRVDVALRALSPAQLGEMNRLPDGPSRLDAIAAQLHGVDRKVFDLLRDAEAHPENVAKANALRLQEGIDKARSTRGEAGGDKTFKAFESAARAAGHDTLSGDTDAGLTISDTLGNELRRERAGKAWQATLAEFDAIAPPTKDAVPVVTGKDGKPYAGPGLGAYRYAIASRTYAVTRGSREFRETVYYTEKLSAPQAASLEALLVFGVDSPEVAGARLNVIRAQGGKPDPKKLDEIMHDPSLDARPGEAVSPEERTRREKEALKRFDEIYTAYEKYSRPPGAAPRDVGKTRQEFIDWADKSYAGDKEGRRYVESLLKDPMGDPVAAFDYALKGWGADAELLKKTFGRMNARQVDAAVARWNMEHPLGPSLYARLGIFGKGDRWPKLSGDKKNEVEIAAMGVPVTDLDRAQVARMTAKQQIEQSSWLSRKLLAREEYANLIDSSEQLRKQMGFTPEQYDACFDEYGRFRLEDPFTHQKNPLGHFNPKGDFEPPRRGDANAFETAVGMAQLDATNFKEATDRVANFVTTALVVAAAIISTALTMGAAASLWIPVLVTAGAGLLGMGASRLIKGERYGRDDMIKDLAMTVIQTATAGLGAAAGVALKGGLPALRLVAGAWKVPQTAIRAAAATEALVAAGTIMEGTAAQAAQRAALLSLNRGLAFGEELFIGAGSGSFAGGASALVDPDAWREGRVGTNVFHGAFRGLLGGGAGAGAAQLGAGAFTRLYGGGRALIGLRALAEGERPHWLVGGLTRVTGSGSAGFTQSVTEAGYAVAVQDREASFGEIASEGGWAALQNVAQSIGEHGFDERHAAQLRRGETMISEPIAARPSMAARTEPVPTTRPAAETAPAMPAPAREAVAPPPTPRIVAAAAERAAGEPVPARAAPRALEEQPTPSRPAPRAESAEPPGIARPAPRVEPEVPVPGKPRLPGGDDPTAPTPRARRKPPPLPDAARRARVDAEVVVIDKLDPGTGIMAGNPRSREDIAVIYHKLIGEQPGFEVGVYRNTVTGEYVCFQGNAKEVHTGLGPSRHPDDTEGVRPAGYPQRWKEILAADVGSWELEAHYHPLGEGQTSAATWRRLPSAEEGDLHVMRAESDLAGGKPRQSRLHYIDNGRLEHTDFGYDPRADKPYWVDIAVPGGRRERHPFLDLGEYRAFFKQRTGYELAPPEPGTVSTRDPSTAPGPDVKSAMARPVGPGGAPAPLGFPDEFVFHHGTTLEGQAAIAQAGVIANRGMAGSGDFGPAFYVTPSREVAQLYASRRSDDVRDPTLGAVLSFRVPREAMGVIVDVRPGGEHRAAWEAFLDHPAITGPLGERLRQLGQPVTPNELMAMPKGVELREQFFEQFLATQGLSHADAVVGDLGGTHTSGIGRGEQIAIRSQRLADLLTAQLRGARPAPGGPPGLPPVPRVPVIGKPAAPPEIAPTEDFATAMHRPASAADVQERELLPPHLRRRDPEVDAYVDGWQLPGEAAPLPGIPSPPTPEERAAAHAASLAAGRTIDRGGIEAFCRANPKAGADLKRLMTLDELRVLEAIRLLDGGYWRRMAAIADFHNARLASGVGAEAAAKDAIALATALDHPDLLRAVVGARERAAWADVLDTLDPKHKAMALDSSRLRAVARMDRELAVERYARMKEKFGRRKFSATQFEEKWDAYQRAMHLPVASEADAVRRLARRLGLQILKADSTGRAAVDEAGELVRKGGGFVNQGGIDIIGFVRPDPDKPLPKLIDVRLIDDKAETKESGRLEKVPAQTGNLGQHLRSHADEISAVLEAQRRAGVPIDPVYEMAVKQVLDAAQAIEDLDKGNVGRRGGKGPRFRRPRYIEEVARILQENGVSMQITSERGNIRTLAQWLQDYGFRMAFDDEAADNKDGK
jgi:hypothetical protein